MQLEAKGEVYSKFAVRSEQVRVEIAWQGLDCSGKSIERDQLLIADRQLVLAL